MAERYGGMMAFSVLVELRVHPDKLPAFLSGIHQNAQASLRDEPGCLRFDVLQDVEDPLVFRFYEIYRDRDAFETAHRQAPHYARWREVVADCVVPGSQYNRFSSYPFIDELPENRQ